MKYEHSEEEVAGKLGMPRETVRQIRTDNLFEGEDFGIEKRQIRYSKKGVEKISHFLAVTNAQEASKIMGSIFIEGSKPQAKTEVKKAIIKAVFIHNQKFMDAMMGEIPIVVRVRTNLKFLPGMEIGPAGLIHAGGNLWDYVGRLPRERGRW